MNCMSPWAPARGWRGYEMSLDSEGLDYSELPSEITARLKAQRDVIDHAAGRSIASLP